jgi:hypothetical protein
MYHGFLSTRRIPLIHLLLPPHHSRKWLHVPYFIFVVLGLPWKWAKDRLDLMLQSAWKILFCYISATDKFPLIRLIRWSSLQGKNISMSRVWNDAGKQVVKRYFRQIEPFSSYVHFWDRRGHPVLIDEIVNCFPFVCRPPSCGWKLIGKERGVRQCLVIKGWSEYVVGWLLTTPWCRRFRWWH